MNQKRFLVIYVETLEVLCISAEYLPGKKR
jgi:hypothetical protein